MNRPKSLDDHIIEIFQKRGNQKLRWRQIRNELLSNEEIPLAVRNSEGFSVKLSRSLNRLVREDVLNKHEEGHRNVSYSLKEDAAEKLIERHGPISIIKFGAGLYSPGCSYQKVRKRALQQWIEYFEEYYEPEL